jgi:hypothetical protein
MELQMISIDEMVDDQAEGRKKRQVGERRRTSAPIQSLTLDTVSGGNTSRGSAGWKGR